jgi:hypothetical protein
VIDAAVRHERQSRPIVIIASARPFLSRNEANRLNQPRASFAFAVLQGLQSRNLPENGTRRCNAERISDYLELPCDWVVEIGREIEI